MVRFPFYTYIFNFINEPHTETFVEDTVLNLNASFSTSHLTLNPDLQCANNIKWVFGKQRAPVDLLYNEIGAIIQKPREQAGLFHPVGT